MKFNATSNPVPHGIGEDLKKILLVMKLTLLLLIIALFQANAKGFSQVTLHEKNAPLEKVLKSIEKQSGYTFLVDINNVKVDGITVDVKNASVEETLKACFKDLSVNYKIVKDNVFITRAEPVVSNSLKAEPPIPIVISGRVTNTKGEPQVGVTVIIKGTTKGVITDANGLYRLVIGTNDKTLIFSSIGFKKQEININGRLVINVVLEGEISALDEVQVIAYGTTTKRFNTSNVTTIKAEDIARQPVTNPLAALQGMVPGLVITSQSGVPGGNYNVQLRGQNSLYGGSPAMSIIKGQPLYVIDGVPYAPQALGQVSGDILYNQYMPGNSSKYQLQGNSSESAGSYGLSPLNNIDPANIESIDVLKDADATAIYGSRGANGVILITTKKGKIGATSVTASIRHGITATSNLPDYMNNQQYLAARHEVFKNDGIKPGVNDYDLNGTWDTTRYTNWAKELIKPTTTTNAQFSISGGNEQTQFLLGASYNIMSPPYDGNFSDKNTSVNFNINNAAFNNKFRMVFSGSYSVDDNTLPGMNTVGSINLPPMYPAFHKADGSLNWWGSSAVNPYAQLLNSYHAKTRALISNATISYQLLPGLQIKSSFGYTNTQFNETRLNPLAAKNPLAYNNTSTALLGNNSRDSWIIEPEADYKHQLYKGTLSVMVGTTLQRNINEGQTISGYNYITDVSMSNISAAATTLLSNSYSKYSYAAVFGRINYTLQNKYILNLTGRRDGSSRFAPAKQISNFGAVGAAWIFSEEKLIKDHLPFLSYGKLRGSYGLTGNDGIGDYGYLNTYTLSGNKYYGQPELYPTRLYSTDYSWESNKKLEGGLELGFLKDRILFTASWYRNRSSSQLVQTTLPPTSGSISTSGTASIQQNLPALIQNTGWEFELNTKNIETDDFTWTSAFNISTSSNKLISFPGLANSSYATIYTVGQPLSITKLYNLVDVNPTTGIYEFRKSDGTLASSGLTVTDLTVMQKTSPDFYGMLNNSIRYKGWQLTVMLNFMKQIGKNLLFTQSAPFTSPINMPTFFINEETHWQKPGDISTLQKYSNSYQATAAYSLASQSNLAYSDASFIRCKNISLTYQLNSGWVKHLHLSGANVYFSAQNLFTITNYMGYDPETQGTMLPPSKTYTFGIQITL